MSKPLDGITAIINVCISLRNRFHFAKTARKSMAPLVEPQQLDDRLDTLHSLISSLAAYGGKTAIFAMQTDGEVTLSYAELADRVTRLAQGLLIDENICRGDHVVLLANNSPEWIICCLAIIKAGGVAVPVDVQLSEAALGHSLKDCGAPLIFTNADKADRFKQLDVEAKLRLLDVPQDDQQSWQQLLVDSPAIEFPEVEADHTAAMFYTSGTTGMPKGVPLTNRNLIFQLNTVMALGVVSEPDCFLLPLPLHHVYPFVMGMLTPLAMGLTLALPLALTGPQIMRALRQARATVIIGVPRLYSAIVTAIEERSRSHGRIAATVIRSAVWLSDWLRRRLGWRVGKLLLRPLHAQIGVQLRLLASGGAALPPDVAWRLEAMGWQVITGYGLTETAPLLTFNLPREAKFESAGRRIPGVELRIEPYRPAGDRIKANVPVVNATQEYGEVLARGPNVFTGYHNLSEQTHEAFTDGWFRTGDLGYLDEEGYLHLLGRASTMIVSEGGENIQPDDIEEAYSANPIIREVGVLQKDGRLVGIVVPEPAHVRGRSSNEVDEVVRKALSEASKRLPSYQRVSDYAVTYEPLARTRLGKLQRHLLLTRFDQAKEGELAPKATGPRPMPIDAMSYEDRALLEDPRAKQVWDLLASHYAERNLTPDTSLQLDLGVDSMAWLDLAIKIQQTTGVELSEGAMARIDTVRTVLSEVTRGEKGARAVLPSPLEQPEKNLSERQKQWLRPLGRIASAVSRLLYVLNRVIMRSAFRLQVTHAEQLPEKVSFVLTPNHLSYLDPFVVAAALDYNCLKRTYWGGWTGVAFDNPFKRLLSRLARILPIDPDRGVRSNLALAAAVLKRDQNLIWFPEGERSRTGDLQQFKFGIGMLLDYFRVPVVPVIIEGTYEALPRDKKCPRFVSIRVLFGQHLNPDDLEDKGQGEKSYDRIVNALHEHIAELQRRTPDPT